MESIYGDAVSGASVTGLGHSTESVSFLIFLDLFDIFGFMPFLTGLHYVIILVISPV